MKTLTLKAPARPRNRRAAFAHAKPPPRPSLAEWSKKYGGIVSTGIRDLSTREGFGD